MHHLRGRETVAVVFCLLLLSSSGAATFAQSRETKPVAAQRSVAVTFDDLPATSPSADPRAVREMTRTLLGRVTSNRVPAVGFVNEGKLWRNGKADDALVATLKMWLDAGLELGNHTYSHPDLNTTPLDAYQANVVDGEKHTRSLMERKKLKLRYFRHPFLHAGATPETKRAFEKFIAARGYRVAPVTIDNDEYVYAAVYQEAKESGDAQTMRRVAEAYIPYMEVMFEFYEKYSRETLGYEIPQVLLLHANELNADTFDQLAAMMKRRGYRFVTLEEALKDQAYRLPDTYAGRRGLSWLHRWAVTKGSEKNPQHPSYPDWLQKLYDRREARLRNSRGR
ncbi:MAG TPA: polysaccharide deacetylase family protein [Pyrinomonadaceae bacterium]|jgi:peptidoglycan/xylan/chitin deacetylase (PgdA/CDA1 family)|nr:polysaccharide deacetylase family protein [Pyrinomonadaceae bacterium]